MIGNGEGGPRIPEGTEEISATLRDMREKNDAMRVEHARIVRATDEWESTLATKEAALASLRPDATEEKHHAYLDERAADYAAQREKIAQSRLAIATMEELIASSEALLRLLEREFKKKLD